MNSIYICPGFCLVICFFTSLTVDMKLMIMQHKAETDDSDHRGVGPINNRSSSVHVSSFIQKRHSSPSPALCRVFPLRHAYPERNHLSAPVERVSWDHSLHLVAPPPHSSRTPIKQGRNIIRKKGKQLKSIWLFLMHVRANTSSHQGSYSSQTDRGCYCVCTTQQQSPKQSDDRCQNLQLILADKYPADQRRCQRSWPESAPD